MAKKRQAKSSAEPRVYALQPADLDAVVAIDRQYTERSRRGFFERNLYAVQSAPDNYVTIGLEAGGSLAGFVIARITEGEFGIARRQGVLEAIGVDQGFRGHHFGRVLINALMDELQNRGATDLMSQADWSNQAMLSFFSAERFEVAPVVLLERDARAPINP